MTINMRNVSMFAVMAMLFLAVGQFQSWTLSLTILNLCLISAIMSLGVNIQWGYGGLLNVGVMGFAALGGVAGVLVSAPPVAKAWSAGGAGIGLTALVVIATIVAILLIYRKTGGAMRTALITVTAIAGFIVTRAFFDPAVEAIEKVDSASTGFLGGLGLPIIFSWAVGGVFGVVGGVVGMVGGLVGMVCLANHALYAIHCAGDARV